MIRLLRAHFAAIREQGRVVAELKPVQPTEGISLSRWSRLKRAAADEQAVRAEPIKALVASETGKDGQSSSAKIDAASNAEYADLPPISAISLAEDFTPFMQAKVPQALKQQALKALFREPHFNVMDGLDIYIDDYTVFEPISPEVMATLSSWKTIMNPPQQVVTNGGYAVDVESEEGKAVLAARAELAQANAALQPSECDGVEELSSPAVRNDGHVAPGSGAEGDGGDIAEPTLQTINPASTYEPLQVNEVAVATALTPALSCRAHSRKHALAVSAADRMRSETPPTPRAAGEGAKPHTRYGKRVGDFSASTYAAAEQAARDSETAEPTATPIAAPKSITQ